MQLIESGSNTFFMCSISVHENALKFLFVLILSKIRLHHVRFENTKKCMIIWMKQSTVGKKISVVLLIDIDLLTN